MANLDFITNRLATGGDLPYDEVAARHHIAEWLELGITHVIDNRLEWDDTGLVAAWAPQISYLHNGADDAGQRMPDGWFDRGVEFACDALQDPEAKVLTHCHMGINRGPSLAFAILLADRWDPIEAMDAVRSARPIAGLAYAEDALDWRHRRQNAPTSQQQSDRRRMHAWRRGNSIDVVRIIRRIRAAEAS